MIRRSAGALVAAAAVATAVSALAVGTVGAQTSGAVRGEFSLQGMAHQSTAQFPKLFNVKPWDGGSLGRFSYRSIPCTGNAPVNNISSDLPSYNTRVAGSRAPSSTRLHNLSFRVVEGKNGKVMLGTVSIVACQLRGGPTPNPDPISDEVKPRIRVTWRASFTRNNAESVRFKGTFKLVGGTERYADITGGGSIAGYLFCFAPAGCAGTGGSFQDAQVSIQGDYRDPTPQL